METVQETLGNGSNMNSLQLSSGTSLQLLRFAIA